jgi:hypothetical protein
MRLVLRARSSGPQCAELPLSCCQHDLGDTRDMPTHIPTRHGGMKPQGLFSPHLLLRVRSLSSASANKLLPNPPPMPNRVLGCSC